MPRFFIDDRPQGELLYAHGRKMRIMQAACSGSDRATLTLCDGAGTDFDCTVEQAERTRLSCRVQAVHRRRPNRQDMSCSGAAEGATKMEFVIQKSVELGVRKNRTVPVKTGVPPGQDR